jgi:hypothetical protein
LMGKSLASNTHTYNFFNIACYVVIKQKRCITCWRRENGVLHFLLVWEDDVEVEEMTRGMVTRWQSRTWS